MRRIVNKFNGMFKMCMVVGSVMMFVLMMVVVRLNIVFFILVVVILGLYLWLFLDFLIVVFDDGES